MKGKLMVILPWLLVPLLLGGGFMALGGQNGGLPVQIVVAKEQPAATAQPPEPAHGITLSTKERVITLADTQVLRYLKTEVVLEFEPDKDGEVLKSEEYKKAQDRLAAELAPALPAIEDAITAVFASRTAAEVATPDGKERVKTELMERLSHLRLARPVRNVYFTQFIIQ